MEAAEDDEGRQEHVYHSLERQDDPPGAEPVYTQPLKLVKVRFLKHLAKVLLLLNNSQNLSLQ